MAPVIFRTTACAVCLLLLRAGFWQDAIPVSAAVTSGTAISTGSLQAVPLNAADFLSSRPLSGPLGLGETDDLLARAQVLLHGAGQLRASGNTTASLECERSAAICVEMSRHYLERVSENQRGHIRYTWIPLGKSQPLEWDETSDSFPKNPRDPLRGVMALRFAPRDGAISIGSVQVCAADGALQVYSLDKMVVPDLPKREVLYLRTPANLAQVVLFMRNPGKETHRMLVEAGVPERPEYALETAALCDETLALVREEDLPGAEAALLKTRNRLKDYQSSLVPAKEPQP